MQTAPYKPMTYPWLVFTSLLLGASWFLLAFISNYLTAWFLPASLFPSFIPAPELDWLRYSLPRLILGLPLYWLLVPALLGVNRKNYSAFLRASGVVGFRRGGFGTLVALISVSVILSGLYLTRYGGYSEASGDLAALTNWWAWLSDVQPPLVEEMLYRGILLSLLVRYTKPWIAVTVSSLLFGILHLVVWGTLSAFVQTSAIAVLFALGWFVTGSLWTGVLAHFAMNHGLFVPVGVAYILVLAVASLFKRRAKVETAATY